MSEKRIRFITPEYQEKFRIKDGEKIQIKFNDRNNIFIAPCKYLDDYHVQVGQQVFHICQYAEILARDGGEIQPEPILDSSEAAWQVKLDKILTIQSSEDGWDYSIYDRDYHLIDGGQVNDPDINIQKCRDQFLEANGWENYTLKILEDAENHLKGYLIENYSKALENAFNKSISKGLTYAKEMGWKS